MRRSNLPFPRSHAAVAALTALALGLSALGVVLTHRAVHLYLVWNLFLALLPVAFAWGAHLTLESKGWGRAWLPAGLWLLFLPNSVYILTDFIHLPYTDRRYVWEHLLLLVCFSGAGLFAGLLSLRIVHSAVDRRHPPAWGWAMVASVSLLSGVGVSLGRFQRWNSWDALHAPLQIVADLARDLTPGEAPRIRLLLPLTLGVFFGLAYLVLWGAHADGAQSARSGECPNSTDPGEPDHSGIASAVGSGRKNEQTKLNT